MNSAAVMQKIGISWCHNLLGASHTNKSSRT